MARCSRGLPGVTVCALFAGCASAGSSDASQIETTVQAWPSGVTLMFNGASGATRLAIEIHDFTGTRERLQWQIPQVQALPAYQRLVSCVERVRAHPGPQDLRKAVLRCVETSGMPPPEVIPEPDATEYRVSIRVGLLRALRRLRPPAVSSVVTDVDQCRGAAEKEGVGIQLLVDRFDACLRKRSYLVDDPPRASQPQ
jgi:hypothetical protein